MPNSFWDRLKRGWNAFTTRDWVEIRDIGPGYSRPPNRVALNYPNEQSIVSAIYNRIGLDVSSMNIEHVRTDENGRFVDIIDSGLNNCLTMSANIDQTGRNFIMDVVLSMFDEGTVAIVPVDTTTDPKISGSYDIITMRTGKILEWYPYHVRLNVYNERSGNREEITLPKSTVAIIENPLYPVMNEQNSTLKRLISKLVILDAIDNQSGSGKLDMIIQLPYTVRSETKQVQAQARIDSIVKQLQDSKYGIAYADATEKVTQLNRPVENNLMDQIEFLTSMLYSQLGLTQAIFDGTADEKQIINYYNRTVEPVVSSIVDGMKRTFLTKTARSQGQSIMFFRDPFKLVGLKDIADAADSLSRNEIVTSNEIRSEIGMKPSKEKSADQLRNKNLNPPTQQDSQQKALPTGEQTKSTEGATNA